LPERLSTEDRRQLERELRHAVATGALHLEYQPQLTLRTGRVTWFEALLRWQHPTRGLIRPDDIIPMAERLGLIGAIGAQVLDQACREAVTWPEDIGVAVNVSATQFGNGELPVVVAAALRQSGLPPSRLELEVTETALIDSDVVAVPVMRSLREIGVRLVIDDFGVGHSSLSYLIRFPFDKLKIDRSFVSGLGHSRTADTVVRAVIGLCSSLRITSTAEGVETAEQLAMLTHEDCAEAQGFLFGKPAPASDLPAMLRRLTQRPTEASGTRRHVSAAGISFFQIAETANDIILVTTPDLEPPGPTIVYVNPAFMRLTGYSAAEAIGLTPRLLQGPGTNRATLATIAASLREGRPVRQRVLNYAKSGAPYWLDLRIVPLRDAEGNITHFAAIERDVTMDKRRVDELESMDDRDTLTGISNRPALMRAVADEIEMFVAYGAQDSRHLPPCLAFIDIDHFRDVNRRLGHAIGDMVLFGVADRLADNVRRSDMLGRIGGEEFAVFMRGVTVPDAEALAERLRCAISAAPFETPMGPVEVSIGIGVAGYRDGDSVASLMQRAETARYAAGRTGGVAENQPIGSA
jgi:diguanylate cyclase (GGDEF)-like protein/PAS domain S-box-containing protein